MADQTLIEKAIAHVAAATKTHDDAVERFYLQQDSDFIFPENRIIGIFVNETIARLEHERDLVEANAVLAKCPPSYTLKQIRAAAIKCNWLNAGVEIIARLQLAPMPKPKTAEQRVIVNEGLSPNHNAAWVVQLDGENILYMRKDWYSREDAETFRIGKIAQLRKESEAHNGKG